MAPQTGGSRGSKGPVRGMKGCEGTERKEGEGYQVMDGEVVREPSQDEKGVGEEGGYSYQNMETVDGECAESTVESGDRNDVRTLKKAVLEIEMDSKRPLMLKKGYNAFFHHPKHHPHPHHHYSKRHPHLKLSFQPLPRHKRQPLPTQPAQSIMGSDATLCSTVDQEEALLGPGNSGSHHQGAAATGSGSGGQSLVTSERSALTFGEVSVPERLMTTPLHRTDHKAYYSFVNPALVPSLTDFQMQTKGKDEWYLDSDGLAHLYEVPPSTYIKSQMAPPARRAIKNLMVLSLAFMFVLTAFVCLQTLQSSMNHADGLGVVSLSCVYAATVVSCLLAPAVIKQLTTKWTLVMAFSLFLIYIGCNFYPIAPVVIPASVLLGLLTGPLWSAQSTYLTTLAIQYAATNKQLQDTTINKFNGIFMSIVQTSQVWGNLISTMVLSHDNVTATVNKAISQANIMQLDVITAVDNLTSNCPFRCGALDCGVHVYPDVEASAAGPAIQHTVAHVPTNVRMLLLGVQLACAITGIVLVTSLLDRNSLNTTDGKYPGSLSSQQLFSATFKMFQDPRLQLLLPLVVFTGLEQGFVFGEFTKSYVNCALGIHQIGSVMMCFGAMTALSALFIGAISRHIKRLAIMTSGTLFNTGLLIVLLWWKPRHDDLPMFYVIASCLGLCDAIWQTQTNTLFGVLFAEKQEAGFASYRMFQAVGFAISFGYSYYLCVSTKVYIMTAVLLISLLLYSVIEVRLYQQARTREGVVVL